MSKKIKYISFIVIDVIVLAFFGFYLTINLKYRDVESKEDMSLGDFRLQSLFANSTTNGGSGGSVRSCTVRSTWPGTWSINESHVFSINKTPSNASGLPTWSSSGSCTMSGSTATCKSKGGCTIKATFANGVSCSDSISCACTAWSGPKTVNHVSKAAHYGETMSWADATDAGHYYNTGGWTNCNATETDCTNTAYYTRDCGNGPDGGGGGSSSGDNPPPPRIFTLTVNHYIVGTTTKAPNNCNKQGPTDKTEGTSYSTSQCSTLKTGWRLHHTDGDATSGTMDGNKVVNYYYEEIPKCYVNKTSGNFEWGQYLDSANHEAAKYTNGNEIPQSDCSNPTFNFRKISNDTSQPVAGATLKLYQVKNVSNQTVSVVKAQWVQTSTNSGYYSISLPVGEYDLYEIGAPNGYILNKHPVHAVVTKNKVVTPSSKNVSVGDWSYKDISFVKTDSATGQPLAGAELAILDKNKNEVHSWVSDGTPKVFNDLGPDSADNLVDGMYYFVEKNPAPMHIINRNQIVFYIKTNGHAAGSDHVQLQQDRFTMGNVPCPYVNISKYDKDTGNKLSGAKLRLVDSEGNVVETWTTADKSIQVCPDKYYVEEVEAPKYYIKDANKYEFEVKEDASVTPNNIKLYNKKYPEIQIMKSDSKTSLPVQEAQLSLYQDGNLLTDFHWTVDGNIQTDSGYYNPWVTNAYPVKFYFAPGTYVVKETSVPSGYIKASDFTFTVDENGIPSTTYIDMLDIPYPELKIGKIDALTNEYIADAKLKLVDHDGNLVTTSTDNRYWVDENGDGVIDYFKSTSDGFIKFILKPGEYTLKELEAPNNYIKYNKDITITVNDDGTINPRDEIKVTNVPCPKITISKQTSTSTEELAGAMIKLTNTTTGEIRYVQTEHEPKEIQVCVGNWEMNEITPPEGYTKDPFTKRFTVDDEGNTTKREFIFSDHIYPEALLFKRDRVTNDVVRGAVLRLEKENGEVLDEWTSLDVPHRMRLAPGTYRLIEVEAPNGYVKTTEPVVFEIEENTDTETREISIYNTPYPSVYISKIDSITKEPIDGAFMMITDYSGTIVDTWESIPDYHKVILAPGKYTVTETRSAPNHVFTSETIEIEVNELGEVIGDYELIDNKIVFKLENVPYPKVRILKVDPDGNALLGAKLKLTDINGNTIEEWISNTRFKEVVLGPGKYYLEETEAPQGYIKSNEKIEINVSDDAVATPSEVRMTNKSAPTIRIDKRDATSNENIAGAEMIIRRADNHQIVATFISTTNSYNIKLQPGSYELLENVAPNGYQYNEQIVRFVVNEEGSDPSPVVFENNRLKTISLAKVDSETGALIPGAVLVVKDMNDIEIARVTTETRRVNLSKYLDAGQYKLVEEVAPEHYAKSDEVKLFTVTIDENPILEIDFANTMMRKLCLYKTDSETGAKVAGATLRLTNKANGQIIHDFETVSDCYNYEVPYGTYILEEIKAPNHYQKTNEKVEITIDRNSSRNIEVHIANPPYRDLSVAKVDTDTNDIVPGAKLELTYPDGTKKEIITGTERIIINDLYYGNYKLQEIAAPQNYKFNGQVYEFTVNDQSPDVINYDINDYKLRLISVAKVDSENGRFIPGVTLEIRNSNGTLIDKVVTEDEPVVVHDRDNRLDYGIYTVTEEEAPNGYQVNANPTVFTINNNTSRDDNNLTVVRVNNTPYRKVRVCKTDSETRENIAGAKLELTYPDGTKKEIISTTDCALLSDIVYGEYKLVELEAPTGYEKNNEELVFNVSSDSDRELEWSITNVPLREMIIYKVDKEDNTKVAGAKLKLVYPDGTEKEIISTVEGVKLEGIKYGNYTLTELASPSGYQLNSEEVSVTVNTNSPKEIEVKISDVPYRMVNVCKLDSETLERVAGAKLELKYPDGTTKEIISNNECTLLTDIVYGDYELREIEEPTGYEKNNEILEFTINSSSDRMIEWTIKNKPLKALSIAVIDEETKVLVPDSDVIVYNGDEDSIDDYTTTNERELIEKLPYNRYCVKVLRVPEGYQDPTVNPVCVTIDKDSPDVTYVDIPLRPYYKLKVVKYGVNMGTNLAGAKFELRNEDNDELIKEFTTEENATYIDKLLPGKYYLVELVAPEGYIREEERIPIEIVTGNEITEITVIDNIEVPITGKTNTFVIISVVLGSLGLGVLNISKKQKKYE